MRSILLSVGLLLASFAMLLGFGGAIAAPSADPPPGHPAWHSDSGKSPSILGSASICCYGVQVSRADPSAWLPSAGFAAFIPAPFDPMDPGRMA